MEQNICALIFSSLIWGVIKAGLTWLEISPSMNANNNEKQDAIKTIKNKSFAKLLWTQSVGNLLFLNKLIMIMGLIIYIHEIFTKNNTNHDNYNGYILNFRQLTGLALSLIGQCIRYIAKITLSRQFTYDVSIIKDHQLITNGFYGIVRHPAYTGAVLMVIGDALFFNNIFFYIPTLLIIMFIKRTYLEDHILREQFGVIHQNYCKQVPYKLIPFVF